MWINDIKLQDDAKPVGYHTFHCPLYVFKALRNWMFDSPEAHKTMDPGSLEGHHQRCAINGSKPDSAALWDPEAYNDWTAWTSASCDIIDLDCDHHTLKVHKQFTDFLWNLL